MNNICRVCETSEIFANLFENPNRILLKMFKAFAAIQLDPNDCLPKYICKKCLISLQFAYKFKKQCEYTDQKLRNLLEADERNEEISNYVYLEVAEVKDDQEQGKNAGQDDSKNIDLLKIHEVTFVECSNSTKKLELKEEVDDMDENQVFKIDVLDEMSEKKINNATYQIENINEFEEQNVKYKSDCTDVDDDEIYNQSNHQVEIEKRKPQNNKRFKIINGKIKHYTCDTCNKIFYCFKELTAHKQTHGNQRYQCSDCGEWFPLRHKLKIHKIKHENEGKYSCDICPKRYKNKVNLTRHIRIIHNQERRYTCDKCGKCFGQSNGLKQHEAVHVEERQFECDICNKRFKSNTHLSFHKKRHFPTDQEEKRIQQRKTYSAVGSTFLCSLCGKLSKAFNVHEHHMRTHTGEQPFECFVCKKRFRIKQQLRVHFRLHSDERPYKCDLCHLTFRQTQYLRRHKLVHTGVKAHQCKFCSKSFALSGTLAVHLRLHTGETPYHCKHCPKKFIDSNGLKRHQLVHTQNCTKETNACNSISTN